MSGGIRPELTRVPADFDAIAPTYDLMLALSPGYHRHLRRSVERLRLSPPENRPLRLLDLGCGTGASTRALLRVHPAAEVVAVDASAGMLSAALAKPWPGGVRFVPARAEQLSDALAAAGIATGFDGVLAAYVVRNVTDCDAVLRTIRDLLVPAGRLAVHEYSVADSRRARLIWRAVCHGVVVPAGWLVSRQTALYRYLERSVLDFDGVRGLEERLRSAGFCDVATSPVSGLQRGIVHTVIGTKPR